MKIKWELNDLSAFLTLLNVILVIAFGNFGLWFGVSNALIMIFRSWFYDRKVNGLVTGLALLALNIHFLLM